MVDRKLLADGCDGFVRWNLPSGAVCASVVPLARVVSLVMSALGESRSYFLATEPTLPKNRGSHSQSTDNQGDHCTISKAHLFVPQSTQSCRTIQLHSLPTKRRKRASSLTRISSMPMRLLQETMCESCCCLEHYDNLLECLYISNSLKTTLLCRSDAPAVSTDGALVGGPIDATISDTKPQQEEWDDTALASDFSRKATTTTDVIRDMKSLENSKGNSGNIAEKLRVEETKAQLAAAREGMEREARLLKEKKEADEAKKKEVASRFSDAAANIGGGSSMKWQPPSLTRVKMGASTAPSGNRRFNVEDEELFPDLAAAGKILEQKEKEQQAAFKPVKKTPVGGGATWASKPKSSSPSRAVAPEPEPAETPATEIASEEVKQEESTTAPLPAAASTPASDAPKIAPLKKKKKDLSTFKPKA